MSKYENAKEPKLSAKWFVNFGCSNHMTNNKSLFSSYVPEIHCPAELGNSDISKVLGTGTIYLDILPNDKRTKCQPYNVLYVPELGYKLLSAPTFDNSGLDTSFHSSRCWIQKDGALLATGTTKGNLYQLDVPTSRNDSEHGTTG